MNRTRDAPSIAAERQNRGVFSSEPFGGSVRLPGAENAWDSSADQGALMSPIEGQIERDHHRLQ